MKTKQKNEPDYITERGQWLVWYMVKYKCDIDSACEALRKKEKEENYQSTKERVLNSRHPDNKDYEKLSYEDRDEWFDKYFPGFNGL